MQEADLKEIEIIRALVEFTWKQENMDKIAGDIRDQVDKICHEVRSRIDQETFRSLEMKIKEDLLKQFGETQEVCPAPASGVDGEENIARNVYKRITEERRPARILLAFCLGIAGIGLGITIAALAGLMS